MYPPRVAVFFDEPSFDDYPFDDAEYRASYRTLGQLIAKKGGEMLIVRSKERYLGGNQFQSGWRFNDDGFESIPESIESDLIFNRGYLQPDENARIINHPTLDDICTDKKKTAEVFPDFVPVTISVESPAELEKALPRIPSETIVAKPHDLWGGKGVIIGAREKIIKKIKTFPYLLQQFINMSKGIPGLTPGHHDIRLMIINGDVISAYLRTPAHPLLPANIDKGGSSEELPVNRIPAEALTLATHIDAMLKRYGPRVYAADVARDAKGRWYLLELNAKVGLPGNEMRKDGMQFMEKLAEMLVKEAARTRGSS